MHADSYNFTNLARKLRFIFIESLLQKGGFMKSYDLNLLPQKINEGSITTKQAVDCISSFVIQNYRVFGLQKYDEDFRSDILVSLLERGEHLIHLYNPEYGDFFSFLYCYIQSLANSQIKSFAKRAIQEKINFEEGIKTLEETNSLYQRYNSQYLEETKVPYAPKKVPAEELSQALQQIAKSTSDKKMLVLALKSSFYITDYQISRICKMYRFNPEHFYALVQYCKDSINRKAQRREMFQQRRNFAYYHHKRYKKLIDNLQFDDKKAYKKETLNRFVQMEQKHKHNWQLLNQSFQNGLLTLRPTNKTIAKLLGICERQVTYYLNCAKKDAERKEAENSKICKNKEL